MTKAAAPGHASTPRFVQQSPAHPRLRYRDTSPVDGQVEESQISPLAGNLKADSNRPDVLELERWLLT